MIKLRPLLKPFTAQRVSINSRHPFQINGKIYRFFANQKIAFLRRVHFRDLMLVHNQLSQREKPLEDLLKLAVHIYISNLQGNFTSI